MQVAVQVAANINQMLLVTNQCFCHRWLGIRKSIQPVKSWVTRCWRRYLFCTEVQMICIPVWSS